MSKESAFSSFLPLFGTNCEALDSVGASLSREIEAKRWCCPGVAIGMGTDLGIELGLYFDVDLLVNFGLGRKSKSKLGFCLSCCGVVATPMLLGRTQLLFPFFFDLATLTFLLPLTQM